MTRYRCFFFLIVRRPPRANRTYTLFPYTTLFRALASPPMVVAYALAGSARRDILGEPVGRTAEGEEIPLARLWPSGAEIDAVAARAHRAARSEEHTSELQSLMRISYAVFCLKKKKLHK